jgi:nicotinate-nucleotide adenylyltransferase
LYKTYKKIGILGGTFDPPHYGHLAISKVALKQLKVDKIFWIITKQNPFKNKPRYNYKKRKYLSEKIVSKEKAIIVKKISSKLNKKNTHALLSLLRKKFKTKFFFLMGADNFINFHKWSNWMKIPKLAKIVVFARPKFSSKALKSVAAKKLNRKDWIYINTTKLNISSSKLKRI